MALIQKQEPVKAVQITGNQLKKLFQRNVVEAFVGMGTSTRDIPSAQYTVLRASRLISSKGKGENFYMLVGRAAARPRARGSIVIGNEKDFAEWRKEGHLRKIRRLPNPEELGVVLASHLHSSKGGSIKRNTFYVFTSTTTATPGQKFTLVIGDEKDLAEWRKEGLDIGRGIVRVTLLTTSGDSFNLAFADRNGERLIRMKLPVARPPSRKAR